VGLGGVKAWRWHLEELGRGGRERRMEVAVWPGLGGTRGGRDG
jgi:hypothetical protein